MSTTTETTTMESEYRTYTAGTDPDGHRWGYHVQIKDPEGTGFGAEIWIDGVKLKHVTRYTVDVGTNTASKVTVTFNAQSVNREPLP